MTNVPSARDRYLTDNFMRKLATISPAECDPIAVRQEYLNHCEEIRQLLREDAPVDVVRRAAFQKTERSLDRPSDRPRSGTGSGHEIGPPDP